jgi:signal transduction histidine kinase
MDKEVSSLSFYNTINKMRNYITILLFALILPSIAGAQTNSVDSLQQALETAITDSAAFKITMELTYFYEELNIDSALYYSDKALWIAKKNNEAYAEASALNDKGYQFLILGKYRESLKCLQQAYGLLENSIHEKNNWNTNRLLTLSTNHHMFGLLMSNTGNTEQEIFHYKEAGKIAEKIDAPLRSHFANSNLGDTYYKLGMLDSALFFAKKAEAIKLPPSGNKYAGWNLFLLGRIYYKMGVKDLAKHYYFKGIVISKTFKNPYILADIYNELTKIYLSENIKDSALYYAVQTSRNLNVLGYGGNVRNNIGTAYENLYLSYQSNNQYDSAFKYQSLALVAKDSLYETRIKSLTDFQNLTFNEQLRLQKVEQEKVLYQNKIRIYASLVGLGIILIIALMLYRNNRAKQKSNIVLGKTLHDLKATQSQLIQSEKMASLGELTAGIAHEIQNPLNFVNNFSEVNTELIDELKAERSKVKAERDETLEEELIADLAQNTEKIHHHGQRASGIVKGMLEHSRTGDGKKELTDINALADEYLRLAYHGLRAKDKSFNADFKTNFDATLPKLNVIPQDIGRVLLNLINNAFYAVDKKAKSGVADYKPEVVISTKIMDDKIEISVKDNGPGIPDNIKDKIFQPFFTTKPTGQGTGLGLSLSYDIVKAHGGELSVVTKNGEGSEFTIKLPVS